MKTSTSKALPSIAPTPPWIFAISLTLMNGDADDVNVFTGAAVSF